MDIYVTNFSNNYNIIILMLIHYLWSKIEVCLVELRIVKHISVFAFLHENLINAFKNMKEKRNG